MASITCLGTWVPAGPSRNAAGWPFTRNCREGNCALTHALSSGLLPASCRTGVLIVLVSRAQIVYGRRVRSFSHNGANSERSHVAPYKNSPVLYRFCPRPHPTFVF